MPAVVVFSLFWMLESPGWLQKYRGLDRIPGTLIQLLQSLAWTFVTPMPFTSYTLMF